MSKKADIAIVVPVKNESDNINPLLEEIYESFNNKCKFEIVYVDDGSDDDTLDVLIKAQKKYEMLKVIQHEKSCGQSQSVATGIKYASAPVIGTLDGDGQNPAYDLPKMFDEYNKHDDKENLLIMGHRHKRKDTKLKKVSSKFANAIRKKLLKDDTPDTGCGTKLFARDAFLDMPRFDHMHRYFPALMIRRGGRVMSMHVDHRQREKGVSKYGFWDRLWVGIFDMIGVIWLIKRSSVPQIKEIDK